MAQLRLALLQHVLDRALVAQLLDDLEQRPPLVVLRPAGEQGDDLVHRRVQQLVLFDRQRLALGLHQVQGGAVALEDAVATADQLVFQLTVGQLLDRSAALATLALAAARAPVRGYGAEAWPVGGLAGGDCHVAQFLCLGVLGAARNLTLAPWEGIIGQTDKKFQPKLTNVTK